MDMTIFRKYVFARITRSLMSIAITLKNVFLTNVLSITTRALKTLLGLSLGSFETNCLCL